MSGFAYVVKDGKVETPPLKEALGKPGSLVWIHLTTNDERAQTWLSGEAELSPYIIDALTAAETRPRCDPVGEGAVINLRGMSSEELSVSDQLASIRMYALDGCVFSVTRKLLNALKPVREQIEAGEILDPGDLIAALPGEWLRDDDRLHLNSAADRAARMAEELEAIRERAALTHETLTDLRAELIDQRSLIIAIAAMVFLPLTFITGLLGMNVDGIPYAHEPWAFDAVLWLCVAIAVVVTAYFVRRHWFR